MYIYTCVYICAVVLLWRSSLYHQQQYLTVCVTILNLHVDLLLMLLCFCVLADSFFKRCSESAAHHGKPPPITVVSCILAFLSYIHAIMCDVSKLVVFQNEVATPMHRFYYSQRN
jgi:hypothetical protein